ncbi:MAG: export protein [Herbaspirillum sp.]|nr:export protein [Herbaspirillum sp.]
MQNDLRSKTVRAISHLGIGGALGKLISLGTTLLLARLLSPADYGLMEIAMMFIGFVGFFNEIGMGAAIVQKTDLTSSEVNGCFAIAVASSVVLFLGAVLASYFIAIFFGHPQLQAMISTLALGFVIGAFGAIPEAFLRKEMQFKAIAGITILAIFIQSVASIALAVAGYGVWSLVWGSLLSAAVSGIGFFVLSPWRPRGRYGIREAVDLAIYGMHVTTTRVFWFLYSNADRAIVGKLLGPAPLGIYGMAFSLATLPNSQITTLVINVASPLFSKLQNDLPRLSSVVLKLTRCIAYVTYPALLGMIACSRELIVVILGPKWIDCLIPFTALCIMGLIKSVDPLLSQVLTSIGNVKKLAVYTAICAVVMSAAFAAGAWLDGLRGVSIAWVLVYPLLSIKLLRDVCRLIGMSIRDYYRSLWPVLCGAAAMGAVVLLIRQALYYIGLPVPAILILEIAAGGLAYLAWIVYIDQHAMQEIRQIMIDLGISETRFDRWPFTRKTQSGRDMKV